MFACKGISIGHFKDPGVLNDVFDLGRGGLDAAVRLWLRCGRLGCIGRLLRLVEGGCNTLHYVGGGLHVFFGETLAHDEAGVIAGWEGMWREVGIGQIDKVFRCKVFVVRFSTGAGEGGIAGRAGEIQRVGVRCGRLRNNWENFVPV